MPLFPWLNIELVHGLVVAAGVGAGAAAGAGAGFSPQAARTIERIATASRLDRFFMGVSVFE